MTNDEIKSIALECGFAPRKQPDGSLDLTQCVYDFANRLIATHLGKGDDEFEAWFEKQSVCGLTQFGYTKDQLHECWNEAAKQAPRMAVEGWRQCAKGQHTSQFCGQLEEAVKALRIENEQLRAERNRAGVEMRNAVAKAVSAEREACAQVCAGRYGFAGEILAESIRARVKNDCDPGP